MTLGVDIGGTTIAIGLVQNGQITVKESFPSFAMESTLNETIEYLTSLIDKFITPDVAGIGVGVPSVVDVKNGIVFDTANIPSWKEVNIGQLLSEKYGVPVKVNNDANCYALGSWLDLPESNRPESLVAITLGTGVGIGIVIDGQIFNGANCGAGELCSLPYKGRTVEDYCGKDFFVSKGISPVEMSEAARKGNREAKAVFDEYGRELGFAVYVALLAYDPHCIVIGGGLSNCYDCFRDSMMQYLRENFPYQKTINNLQIRVANSDSIPVVGAASLI